MPWGFVMSQSQTVMLPSVIESLEAGRNRVKQRLTKVPEYRAFLAIEKAIAEVADISDLVAHLQTAKQRILDRLTTMREYQALLTVDKAIKDFSEILDVVGNDTDFDATPAALETVVEKEEVPAIKPAVAAEAQQPVPAIVATAPLGEAPARIAAEATAAPEMPERYSRDATVLAAAIEAAGERPEKSISDTAERRSTLGLVEEWRLTALVRESYSANLGNEEPQSADEGEAEAEKIRVA
jgi:hypothetical protein